MFGGTTRFIVIHLIGATGEPTSSAWYATLTGIVAVFAARAPPESRCRILEG